MASRYEKEDSKRRILSACVQLFLEKGYQKTTTVEILKKAGVTPSTFYNIYHTKGSILTELTEYMFGNQFNISGKIVGESTNPVLLYAVETCLQLTLAELNENLREIYVEAYTVPENIELIHKKTAVQLQKISVKNTVWIQNVPPPFSTSLPVLSRESCHMVHRFYLPALLWRI